MLQLQIQTNNGNVMNIFSVYRIFAFLGELLRDANDVKKELTNSIERQLDSHWDLVKKEFTDKAIHRKYKNKEGNNRDT